MESEKKTKTKNQTYRYREQVGDCQKRGWDGLKWVKEVKKYKLPVMK